MQKNKNDGLIKEVDIKKVVGLHPNSVNLGLVPYGEDRRFEVTGSPDLLCSLKVVGLDQLPQGTTATLHYGGDLDKDVLSITIHVGESLRSGLLKGTIRLHSPHGGEFSIDVIGLMGPKNGSVARKGVVE